MKFSSKEISKEVNEITDIMHRLNKSFHSNWKDEVHLSYQGYISLCEKKIKILNDIDSECVRVCKEINSFKIDDEIRECKISIEEAGHLSKEAEKLCGGLI